MNKTNSKSGTVSQNRLRVLTALLVLVCGLFAAEGRANILDISVSGDGVVEDPSAGIFCPGIGPGNCQLDSGQNDITVNLTASPAPGFAFQGWGGECASAGNNPTCSLLVAGAPAGAPSPVQSVSASFAPLTAQLTVVLSGSGQGRVQSSGQSPGINCPGDCTELYPLGSLVTLTATTTSPTSIFTGWQGAGCSGTGVCSVALNSAQTVLARFDNDADGDGVLDPGDQCPDTPAGEPVDALGCGPSQVDQDGDGVPNGADECPDTPAGEAVDAAGCGFSQLDEDGDGVLNGVDQCPDTPAGETVDAAGCGPSQLDDDGDGVVNGVDQCPDTPAGEAVDATGCGPSQLDSDGDGVSDSLDQCPDTPAGETVDAVGCSPSQSDDDGDGVLNGVDQCPETPAGAPVDASGCAEIQLFGNDLGSLPGLGSSQQLLADRLDEICPLLLTADQAGTLTDDQRDLRVACSRLKNRDTTEPQAIDALNEINLSQLPALSDYMVELTHTQFRHLRSRMRKVKSGAGRGVSVAGLNFRVNDDIVPGAALQSVFEDALGIGASEEAFSDFGKLGVFLQGDIGDGDRDESATGAGYDFDNWDLTLGADYRFSENFFAGGSLSYGKVDVDYAHRAGSTDVEHWALSFYGGWQLTPAWYLDGLFSYGESEFDLERNISYVDVGGAFDSSQEADTDGDQLFLGLNTGYMLNRGSWRFGPIASLTWLDGSIDGYTEKERAGSSAAWNFKVDERDIESLRFSVGAQLDYIINTSWGVLIPGLRVAYVMDDKNGDERVKVRLASNPYIESELQSDQIVVDVEGRDDRFFDASFNLSTQFPMGISGFFSYQFYSAYDNFSLDSYTIGLRWDKPF